MATTFRLAQPLSRFSIPRLVSCSSLIIDCTVNLTLPGYRELPLINRRLHRPTKRDKLILDEVRTGCANPVKSEFVAMKSCYFVMPNTILFQEYENRVTRRKLSLIDHPLQLSAQYETLSQE